MGCEVERISKDLLYCRAQLQNLRDKAEGQYSERCDEERVVAWWRIWLRRRRSTGGSWVRIPLQPPCRDLGQVLYLKLPVALRRVSSNTVSIAVVGSASERLRL